MQIRSITAFADIGWPPDRETIASLGRFLAAAKDAFTGVGLVVQSTRLATVPFGLMLGPGPTDRAVALARVMEHLCQEVGIVYCSLGPVTAESPRELIPVITDMLAATTSVFAAVEIASPAAGVQIDAIREAATLIRAVSTISADGFTNLRLAALAHCPPGSPFFPVAYHAGGPPVFAVATEAADLAVSTFADAGSLAAGWGDLVTAIEANARRITEVAESLTQEYAIPFGGIDFSLAPFPQEARSLGAAMERLGVPQVGDQGSLFAAALLADALDRADFPRCGFSGLMLPVLEDAILARRVAEGTLMINDLLLYSAVCGAGLDTLPLPGDTPVEVLMAMLLDVAALASRLNKPLTARLMPLPGLQAGDPVTFEFPYFADSRVLGTRGTGLRRLPTGTERVLLSPRHRGLR